MGKHESGRRESRPKYETPLISHHLRRNIWSPQPIALIPVIGPLAADAAVAPASVKFFVDTGADITVIPRHIADLHRIQFTKKQRFDLTGFKSRTKAPDGKEVKVSLEGYLNEIEIALCGTRVVIDYVVVLENVPWAILGRAGVIDKFRISVGGGLLTIEAIDVSHRET
jgi:hypothetical protein